MRRAPEPPEGSHADWFARGYRQGISDGTGAATRELLTLRTHAFPLAEQAAAVAELAKSVVTNIDHLIEQMNARWGKAQFHPDRWEPHPMYLLGVDVFRRSYEGEANDTASAVRSGRKSRPRKKVDPVPAAHDPGPTLNLDATMPAAEPNDASLSDEEQMRRAAGKAWRA